MLVFGAVIIAVCMVLFWLTMDTRAIAGDGWTMYFHPGCGFCVTQKAYLGWSQFLIPSVNCVTDSKACSDAGVKVYPTWYNSVTGGWHEGSILDGSVHETLKSAGVRPTAPVVVIS